MHRKKSPFQRAGEMSMTSAAMQDHILRSMGLPTASGYARPSRTRAAARNRPGASAARPTQPAASSEPAKLGLHTWQCDGCKRTNPVKRRVCSACGAKRDMAALQTREPAPLTPSLAQALGIVAAPATQHGAPSSEVWHHVKATALLRGEDHGQCAICMEQFGLRDVVLTSCSHVFHASCLAAFERFAQRAASRGTAASHTCPVCRRQRYHKRPFYAAAVATKHMSATKIQAWWKMAHARRKFLARLHAAMVTGTGPLILRKRWAAGKLHSVSSRYSAAMVARTHEVNSALLEADDAVASSWAAVNAAIAALEARAAARAAGGRTSSEQHTDVLYPVAMPRVPGSDSATGYANASSQPVAASSGADAALAACCKPARLLAERAKWQAAWDQAVRAAQASDEGCSCAVCMIDVPFPVLPSPELESKPAVLTTCGHIFHAQCLHSWEQFKHDGQCPMCRQAYQRAQVQDVARALS